MKGSFRAFFLFAWFSLSLYLPLTAQLPDSLQVMLQEAATPQARAEVYLKIAKWQTPRDSSLHWHRLAVGAAQQAGDDELLAKTYADLLNTFSHLNAGDSILAYRAPAMAAVMASPDTLHKIRVINLIAAYGHHPKGEYAEEIALLEQARELIQDNPNFAKAYGILSINLINTYWSMGASAQSLQVQEEIMQRAQEQQDSTLLREVYHQIGTNLVNNQALLEGVDMHLNGLRVAEALGDSTLIIQSLSRIGQSYGYGEKFPEALEALRTVLAFYEKTNSPADLYYIRFLIAKVYAQMSDPDKCLPLLDSCEAFFLSQNDAFSVGRVMLTRVLALAEAGRWQQAAAAGELAEKHFEQLPDGPGQRLLLTYMHEIYAELDQYQNAYKALGEYKALEDSHALDDFMAQSKFQQQRLELEMEQAKTREMQLKSELQTRRFNWLMSGLIAVLLIGFLLGYGHYRLRKQAKAYQALLEAEVKERTEALVLANQDLRRSNVDLERFAYVASHDLREPIHNILNFVDLINRDKDKLPPRYQTYLGFMASSALNMHRLVQELLVFSQVKANKERWSSVDLNEVVEEARKKIENKAPRPIDWKIGPLPTLYGDALHLRMLFERLFTNAITYNHSPVPEIQVEYHPEEEVHRFQVQDNGIGISPEYHDRIFEVFARLHTREAYPGTGISLATCKRIIQFYRGEIGVESQEGEGARFFFVLSRALVDLPQASTD